jgi:virulence factor
MDNVNVAVVGAGKFAEIAILPLLKQMKNIRLVGIASRTEEKMHRLADLFGIPETFLSIEDLIQKTKPDCAFVLTPPEAHMDPTVTLLESGIDVFCEKPLANDLQTAEKMVKTAKETNKILMVGMNRRYSPACVMAKEAFKGIKIEGCVLEKYKRNPDKRPLLNDCVHLMDLMRWFCGGEYKNVSAIGNFEKDPYHEQTVTAIMEFTTGTIGTFFMNRNAGQWKEHYELHGGGLTAIIDWPTELRLLKEDKTEVFDFRPPDWAWAADPLERGGFRQEVEDFIRCIKTRDQPLTHAADVIVSHRLIWDLYRECGLPLE